jgi:hypothetical protein
MKNIINGKKYDTNTAKLIFAWITKPGLYFRENSQCLFQKFSGEYFLLHSILGHKTILPLTDEEALSWSEKHMTVEEYESIIGAVSE